MGYRKTINIWGDSYDNSAFTSLEYLKIKAKMSILLANFQRVLFFFGHSFSEQYYAVRIRHRENIYIWGDSYDESAFMSFEFSKIKAKMSVLLKYFQHSNFNPFFTLFFRVVHFQREILQSL